MNLSEYKQIYMNIIIFNNTTSFFNISNNFNYMLHNVCLFFQHSLAEQIELSHLAPTTKNYHIFQGALTYTNVINQDNNIILKANLYGLGPATKSHFDTITIIKNKWFVPYLPREDLILIFQNKLAFETRMNVNINQLLYDFS